MLIAFGVFVCMYILVFGLFNFPVALVHTLYFESCTIGYGKPPDMAISLTENVIAILGCISISWFLASKSEDLGTINGMGTKLMVQEKSSAGYITTEWLVMMFLPFRPIKSYEVYVEQQGTYERAHSAMHPLPSLAWNQVLLTYLKSVLWYFFCAAIILVFALPGVGGCF